MGIAFVLGRGGIGIEVGLDPLVERCRRGAPFLVDSVIARVVACVFVGVVREFANLVRPHRLASESGEIQQICREENRRGRNYRVPSSSAPLSLSADRSTRSPTNALSTSPALPLAGSALACVAGRMRWMLSSSADWEGSLWG